MLGTWLRRALYAAAVVAIVMVVGVGWCVFHCTDMGCS